MYLGVQGNRVKQERLRLPGGVPGGALKAGVEAWEPPPTPRVHPPGFSDPQYQLCEGTGVSRGAGTTGVREGPPGSVWSWGWPGL